MRHWLFAAPAVSLFGLLAVVFQARGEALIDPALRELKGASQEQIRRVIVLPVSHSTLPRPARYDRGAVIRYFREVSREAVAPLAQSIQRGELTGVRLGQTFWMNGAVVADITYQGLINLARHPDVYKIYADRNIKHDLFNSGHGVLLSPDDTGRYDMVSTGIERLHHEFPNLGGDNVLVGVEDSGVIANHPALAGRVAVFYSGRSHRVTPPEDYDEYHGHGTHVCGTIVGIQNDIGVAPRAQVAMAATVIDGDGNFPFDSQLEGMQWFLDADKNPTVAGRVKVVNNSWMSEGAPDLELFYRALAAWEAAGILPVFSAGNAGSNGPGSITHPHEYPGTFSVGNYQADGAMAPDSSIGPAVYRGQNIQKPELAAPGTEIVSAAADGGFRAMSGTSMAAPHVTGVVALILQANPQLNPQQIRALLLEGSAPAPGQARGSWDAHWGFGKLDAYKSVTLTMKMASLMGVGDSYGTLDFENGMGRWFGSESPGQAFFDRYFGEATLGEVGGEVDQYLDTDLSKWITVDEL